MVILVMRGRAVAVAVAAPVLPVVAPVVVGASGEQQDSAQEPDERRKSIEGHVWSSSYLVTTGGRGWRLSA